MTDYQMGTRCSAANAMWDEWSMIEHLMGGTKAMRSARQAYLPQWPAESDEAYLVRLRSSFLFGAFNTTVASVSGRPFVRDIIVGDNMPAAIADRMDNIDGEGRDLDVLARELMHAGMAYGHAFLMLDWTPPEGQRTQADLQASGYGGAVHVVRPQRVLYWKAENINNVLTPVEVHVVDVETSYGGLLVEMPVRRIRVFKPDVIETWFGGGAGADVAFKMESTVPNRMGKVPLYPFYVQRRGFYRSIPPMLDLAYLNVEHWQSSSDQRNILHAARVPILTMFTDDDDAQLTIGGSTAVRLPVGSDMRWIETTGAGIAAGATDLNDIETRMQRVGAEMLMPTIAASATGAALDNARTQSRVAAAAQTLEACLNAMFADWCKMFGADPATVNVYKEFDRDAISSASDLSALLQSALAGKISDETYFTEMQRRGVLANSLAWDDEKIKIAEQGPPLGDAGNGGQGGAAGVGDTGASGVVTPLRPGVAGENA